jgi:hypothetical protein
MRISIKKHEIFVILFLLIGSVSLHICNRKEREYINNNASFTIGTITKYMEYKPPKLPKPGYNRRAYVEYIYRVKDSTYKNGYQNNAFKVPYKGVNVGDKYVVVYNTDDPQKSYILFDKKINDSSDFNSYIKEIKLK